MTIVFNRENKSLIPTPAEIRGSKPQRVKRMKFTQRKRTRYISKRSEMAHRIELLEEHVQALTLENEFLLGRIEKPKFRLPKAA